MKMMRDQIVSSLFDVLMKFRSRLFFYICTMYESSTILCVFGNVDMVAYTLEANYKFIASLRVDPKYEEYQPDFLSFCTHFFQYSCFLISLRSQNFVSGIISWLILLVSCSPCYILVAVWSWFLILCLFNFWFSIISFSFYQN